MQSGSLTIGDTALNYGGNDLWTTNTSGLLLECSSTTEIAVHDAGTRIASCMYYQGDATNQITIGMCVCVRERDSVSQRVRE